MCHINCIMSLTADKLSERAITCMEVMSYNSSESNKDGSGFMVKLADGRSFYNHFDEKVRLRRDEAYQVIATHQRLSTSGKNRENLHPYRRTDFILMHNGIFSELGNKDFSDSSQYADKIQAEMDKQPADKKDIIAAILAVHKEVSGSYSVLIYEWVNNRWLYYKNFSTSMHVVQHPKYLLMSTANENIKFAKWFLQLDEYKCAEVKVKENVIYDIQNFQEVGKIDEKIPYYHSPYTREYNEGEWQRDSYSEAPTADDWYHDKKTGMWRKRPITKKERRLGRWFGMVCPTCKHQLDQWGFCAACLKSYTFAEAQEYVRNTIKDTQTTLRKQITWVCPTHMEIELPRSGWCWRCSRYYHIPTDEELGRVETTKEQVEDTSTTGSTGEVTKPDVKQDQERRYDDRRYDDGWLD